MRYFLNKYCKFSFYWVFFLLIFIYSIFLRFFYTPLETILDFDSAGYLTPSLRFLKSFELYHLYARSYAYPLFCTIVLSIWKSINSIAFVQHVLSSLSCLILFFYIDKQLFVEKNIRTKWKVLLAKFLLLLFFSLTLLNVNIILFEKMARPEGLTLPSIILLLLLLYKILKNKINFNYLLFTVFVFWAFFLILLQPRFILSIYICIGFVFIHFIRFFSFKNIYKIFFILILAYFTINLPEKYLINKYDQTSPAFGYKQFYYSNLFAISKALKDGVYVNEEYDTTLLANMIEPTFNHISDYKDLLGYDIDFAQYIITDQKLMSVLEKQMIKNELKNKHKSLTEKQIKKLIDDSLLNAQYIDYYKKWFWILITKYPFEVLRKTSRQLLIVFFKLRFNYLTISTDNFFENSFDKKNIYHRFLVEELNYKEKSFNIQIPYLHFLLFYFSSFFIMLLLLISFLYNMIEVLLFRKQVLFKTVVGLFILAYIFLIALMHTFDIERYMQSIAPLIYFYIFLFSISMLNYISNLFHNRND